MALRRSLQLFLGSVGVALAGVTACSSFSESDPSPPPEDAEAAAPGSDTSTAADAGPDAAPCDPASDVSTDPANCGLCAHSCLGGTCRGGICQPFVFATSPSTSPVIDLRLENSRALWTVGESGLGEIYGTTLLTGQGHTNVDGTVIDLGMLASPGSLDTDGTHSFVSITGGTPTIASVGPGAITNDAFTGLPPNEAITRLHSRDGAVDFQTTMNALWTAPLGTMKAQLLVDVGSPIVDFAVTTSGLVIAAVSTPGNIYIGACSVVGSCTVLPSVLMRSSPITSFAAEGVAAFWVEDQGTSVSRCVVDVGNRLCNLATVLTTPETLLAIRVDHGVLWAASESSIYMCPSTQVCTNAQPFVRSQVLYKAVEYKSGYSFAATDAAFFWSDRSSGTQQIMEVAR